MTAIGRDQKPQNNLANGTEPSTQARTNPAEAGGGATPAASGGPFGGMVAKAVQGGGMFGGAAGAFGGQAPVPLEESTAFKGLTPAVQAEVKQLAKGADPFSRGTLATVVQHGPFATLSPTDQRRVLDVYRAADAHGRFELGSLSNRMVNGRSALLDKDSAGRTTLDNLHQLATGPLDARFEQSGVTRKALLASTMEEVARPGEINQHSKGTCTVTSVSYALSQRNPAEYARLVQGLAAPAGTVTLRNGDTLTRNDTGIAPDTATQRSPSERLLQSSLMELGNGALYQYDNAADKSTGVLGAATGVVNRLAHMKGVSGAGLSDEATKDVYNAVFGAKAKVVDADKDGAALRALSGVKPNEAMMSFRWGTSAHEVTFDRVQDGRVYFRNPWGGRFLPQGETLTDPPRRLEDPFTGMESMSLADAQKHLQAIVRE